MRRCSLPSVQAGVESSRKQPAILFWNTV
jgi:hypothetical protein